MEEGITSGTGKEIVWTIAKEEFLHIYGQNYVIRVLADDGIEAALGEKITWQKNGSEMMLIPNGTFEMEDHFSERRTNERPVHRVTLDGFYMDATEVTNAQYSVFMEQTGHRQPSYWTDSQFNQPNQIVFRHCQLDR